MEMERKARLRQVILEVELTKHSDGLDVGMREKEERKTTSRISV